MNEYTEILNSIRDIVNDKLPSNDISSILYRHQCYYLLSLMHSKNPYYFKQKIERLEFAQENANDYKILKPILSLLDATNIQYAIIKGAILSLRAYGNENYRICHDIDLLIHPNDLKDVKTVLQNNSFIQGRVIDNEIIPFNRKELIYHAKCSHQICEFVKMDSMNPNRFHVIDINFNIFWGELGYQQDMNYILLNRNKIDIYGIPVYALEPTLDFVVLCLHHYKDMNSIYLLSKNSIHLRLFSDIYFYLKNNEIDLKKLAELCDILNSRDYVYYCIFFTNYIFKDKMLEKYLDVLQCESSLTLINTFGLNKSEIQQWDIPFERRLFDKDFFNEVMATLPNDVKNKIRINEQMF